MKKILLLLALAFSTTTSAGSNQEQTRGVGQSGDQSTVEGSLQTGPIDSVNTYRTMRWVNYGDFKLSTLFQRTISLDLENQYVTEISLRAINAPVKITSVIAYLTNGEVLEYFALAGTVAEEGVQAHSMAMGTETLQISRLELKVSATSYRLLTSLTRLGVSVGFAY
jgi:hypothetical protein